MTYSLNNVPLPESAVIDFDFSGDNDFTVVTSFSCQIGNATLSTADVEVSHLSDRCGGRRVVSNKRVSGVDETTVMLWYNDAIAATDEEFDLVFAEKGNAIGARIYPAGKATNARYFQTLGVLQNVELPPIAESAEDYKFSAKIAGVTTACKVSA